MDAIERAMFALIQVAKNQKLLEVLDQANMYSSSPELGYYAELAKNDLFSGLDETPASVQKSRQDLVESLLGLTDEQAKEFLKMIKGTEIEKVLSYNLQANDVLFRDRIIIYCKVFEDFDLLGMVNGVLKMFRERELPYSNFSERQEIEARKKKVVGSINELKKCLSKSLLEPQAIGLVFDAIMRDDPECSEELSSLLLKKISSSKSVDEIESIVLLWHKTTPEQAERMLQKTALSTSSSNLAKENSKTALIHIGKPMTSTENIILSGNFQGAVVPIKPNYYSEVSFVINNSNLLDDTAKKELDELIKKLQESLNEAPASHTDEAVAVAETAKSLVEVGTKEKVNKPLFEVTAEGLKKAAENIGKVLPAIVPIVQAIIKLLTP